MVSPVPPRRTDPWRAGENEIVDRPAATARDPDRATAPPPARRALSRLPSPRTPPPDRPAAEYEATLRAKIAEEKAKLPPTPEYLPPLPHHLMRAQARVADGAFHDHYSRAYRKLTETRDEFASVAATLREAREKERADAETTMNAKAHTGWELHAKMGDEAHARALDKWEAQRERWEALKRAHALRFDKRPGDLAMERLDEHRRKMEILSHLDMAAPIHEREGGREWEWRMSLRNNWTRYVAVGNVFSELYYVRDELAFADPVHVRRAVNPEDGASYSTARGRSVLKSEHLAARRRRLRRRVRALLPGELDDEEVGMLEVVGEGMANLADARARKRITFEDLEEQIARDSVETWAAIQKRRADERAAEETRRATAAAEAEAREIARLAALGPHCELGAERINATSVAGTSTRVSTTIVNTGSTALFYSFAREEPRRLPHAKGNGADVFFLADREGSVMPGETREIVWTFKAPAAGVYLDKWRLETRPRLRSGPKPPVSLRGVATVEDPNSFPRRAIAAELARKEMVAKVRQAVGHVLKGIVTPSPERRVATRPDAPASGAEPALFRAGNRDRRPRVYYHEDAFAALWGIRARAIEAAGVLPPVVDEEAEKEEGEEEKDDAAGGDAAVVDADDGAAAAAGVPAPPPWGDWDGSIAAVEAAIDALAARLDANPDWEMPPEEEKEENANEENEKEASDGFSNAPRAHPSETLETCRADLETATRQTALPASRADLLAAGMEEALFAALEEVEPADRRAIRANKPRPKPPPEPEDAADDAAAAETPADPDAPPPPPSPEPPWKAVYRRQLADEVARMLGEAVDAFEAGVEATEAEVAAECDRRADDLDAEASKTRGYNESPAKGDGGDWEAFAMHRRKRELLRRDPGEGYVETISLEPSLDFSASERKLRLGVGGRDAKTQKALKMVLDEEEEWGE